MFAADSTLFLLICLFFTPPFRQRYVKKKKERLQFLFLSYCLSVSIFFVCVAACVLVSIPFSLYVLSLDFNFFSFYPFAGDPLRSA